MKRIPPKEAIAEALLNPNGWVYEIDSEFGDYINAPPEGITGAWKVDENGKIIGEFIPNSNYYKDQIK